MVDVDNFCVFRSILVSWTDEDPTPPAGGAPRRRQNEGLEAYHLIRPEGAAHLARPHVIVHRMKLFEDEVMMVDGLPVTTPARTWLDMVEVLDSARPKKP